MASRRALRSIAALPREGDLNALDRRPKHIAGVVAGIRAAVRLADGLDHDPDPAKLEHVVRPPIGRPFDGGQAAFPGQDQLPETKGDATDERAFAVGPRRASV